MPININNKEATAVAALLPTFVVLDWQIASGNPFVHLQAKTPRFPHKTVQEEAKLLQGAFDTTVHPSHVGQELQSR